MDTAIRVLDYRLSLATDNVARTIYTYQISLLKEKIAKTHKKLVTPVSSPLSVSSNKYASLVVEDVGTQYTTDCADATAVSQSEGLGRTNNHNQHNKGLRKGEWWCASAEPEGKSLMGRGDASTPKG